PETLLREKRNTTPQSPPAPNQSKSPASSSRSGGPARAGEMDPDEVKSKLQGLAFGNVLAAAARDYKKVTLARPRRLLPLPNLRFHALRVAVTPPLV
uniref:Uncharacterized protein n=1 Tax=Aegilops tauschii subsp. strangulata TaxID=200361 RepID=A0A453QXN9_AEGTS